MTGDSSRFYDLLLPFLTGKPLEQSLIEVEVIALAREVAASGHEEDGGEDVDDEREPVAPAPLEQEAEVQPAQAPNTPADEAVAAGGDGSENVAPRKKQPAAPPTGFAGAWRFPQRSATAYVRCVFEAMHFLLTNRGGLSELKASQLQLSLQAQLVDMVANDLDFVYPEDNGRRVCEM